MSNQLNIDDLETVITAAIQQLGVAQGYMPFSHYREELINQLGRQLHLLEIYKDSENGGDDPRGSNR
ncbi:hypothetical protein [Pseudomonas phage Astolliot]|nr:hypothetical protein [Pseudomonas phage Astolliot]